VVNAQNLFQNIHKLQYKKYRCFHVIYYMCFICKSDEPVKLIVFHIGETVGFKLIYVLNDY